MSPGAWSGPLLAGALAAVLAAVLAIAGSAGIAGMAGVARAAGGADEQRYAAIDRHALAAPAGVTRTVQTLAAYLVKSARGDEEKARAIFRWIAANIAYDTEAYFKGAYRNASVSAADVLRTRKGVCDGYATLFVALAEAAGLQARKVSGTARGFGYQLGNPLPGQSNHAWNAVRIGDQWRLLDATWAAGYVEATDRAFHPRFEPFFFFPEPQHLLVSHLPEEPQWQLLPRPLEPRAFAAQALLRPSFFRAGLALDSHRELRIQARDGVSVRLRAPTETLLLARLSREGRNLPEDTVFVQRDGDTAIVHAVFPQAGTYVLRLFAKRRDAAGQDYDLAIDYRVDAGAGSAVRFPTAFEAFGLRGAALHEPLHSALRRGATVKFRLSVPGADKVLVQSGGKQQMLAGGNGEFQGPVTVGGGETTVFAKFPGGAAYDGLLRFRNAD